MIRPYGEYPPAAWGSTGRDAMSVQQLNTLLLLSVSMGLLGSGLAAIVLTGSAEALGENVPRSDVLGDYAVAVVWAFLLGLSIFVWPVRARHKLDLTILWVIKVWTALVVMLFYEAHYPFLDAYGYYRVPRHDDFSWDTFQIGQGTENVYRLARLYYLAGPDSYHALKLSFAMVGLLAVYVFYRSAALYVGRDDRRILYVLGLFPSVLFWSSILGKDPLVLLGIALYAYGVTLSWRRGRWSLWPITAGLVLVGYIRIWLVPIFLFALLPILLAGRWRLSTRLISLSCVALVAVVSSIEVTGLVMAANESLPQAVSRLSQAWAEGGSAQAIEADFARLSQLVAFIPLGAFTALFRPLPGEVPNVFGFLAGLENVVLLGLLLLAIVRFRGRDLRSPIVLWAALIVIGWALIHGFVSYQNLGTGVRFRVQILPIFLCLLLYLGRKRSTLLPYPQT